MSNNLAPDKIYIVIDDMFGSMSVNYDRNDPNNIEYLRKDALLEWAETMRSMCVSPKTSREKEVYDTVIMKINEMK